VDGFEPTQPMVTDLQSAATLQLRRTPILKFGTRGGTRTHTVVRPTDFKSVAAAITPLEHVKHLFSIVLVVEVLVQEQLNCPTFD
jgi:hypothetical protein